MSDIATLWDAGGPQTPSGFSAWGEAISDSAWPLIERITGSGNPTTIDVTVPASGYRGLEIHARTRCTSAVGSPGLRVIGRASGADSGVDGLQVVQSASGATRSEVSNTNIQVGVSPGDSAAVSTWWGRCVVKIDLRAARLNLNAHGAAVWNTTSGNRLMVDADGAFRDSVLNYIRLFHTSSEPFATNTVVDVYGIPEADPV